MCFNCPNCPFQKASCGLQSYFFIKSLQPQKSILTKIQNMTNSRNLILAKYIFLTCENEYPRKLVLLRKVKPWALNRVWHTGLLHKCKSQGILSQISSGSRWEVFTRISCQYWSSLRLHSWT